mgnify:CR=1 FL=1
MITMNSPQKNNDEFNILLFHRIFLLSHIDFRLILCCYSIESERTKINSPKFIMSTKF